MIILQICLNHLTDFLNIYESLSAIMEISQPFKSFLITIADTSKCKEISVKILLKNKTIFFIFKFLDAMSRDFNFN